MKTILASVCALILCGTFSAYGQVTINGTGVTFPSSPGNPQTQPFLGGGGGATHHNIVWVEGSGTTAQNGTTLLNTLAGITDASASNPYVVRLSPGVFGCGNTPIQLSDFVTAVGSGQNATKVTSDGGDSVWILNNNTCLQDMTVENDTMATTPIDLVRATGGGRTDLWDVTLNAVPGRDVTGINASGGTNVNAWGTEIRSTGLNPNRTFTGVRASGTGTLINVIDSEVNLFPTANPGTSVGIDILSGGSVDIKNSTVQVSPSAPVFPAVMAIGINVDGAGSHSASRGSLISSLGGGLFGHSIFLSNGGTFYWCNSEFRGIRAPGTVFANSVDGTMGKSPIINSFPSVP